MEKLTIIGAGSMSEALISGMIENKFMTSEAIWVTNRSNQTRLENLKATYGVSISHDLKQLLQETDAVLLAMKPKDAQQALQSIQSYINEETLIISVLAGISIDYIQSLTTSSSPIVRTMPNTSATIGKSATAISVNEHVSEAQKSLAEKMFQTVGITSFVNEDQLDAVTGLSGSGPAYIYYLVEAMEKSAAQLGLDEEMAKNFITQTILGAAEMLIKTKKEPQQLRKEVTSPGGTTEAGLKVLEAHGFDKIMIACIKEATEQSKRLGEMNTVKLS